MLLCVFDVYLILYICATNAVKYCSVLTQNQNDRSGVKGL